MQIKNTLSRYGLITKLFHWTMAILIIAMIALGLYMTDLSISLQKLKLYGWHKEFGVLILMLAILRLSWRCINVAPSLPTTPTWQKLAAKSVHLAFYVFMLVLPITGWLMSCAAGLPVSFFGLFVLPDIIPADKQVQNLLVEIHSWLAYALIAAICAHVGAALQHHFFYKDDTLRRIL